MTVPLGMLLARIGLMVFLYGFLATVLILVWSDLRQTQAMASQKSASRAHVIWREAPPDRSGDFLLTGTSQCIGRSPAAEICLPDDAVSLAHARLWFQENRWWLEDLGSKNGTWLNELPVDRKMVLSPGDRIRCGHCVLEFQAEL
jgi:hypothetical protein